MTRGYSCDNTEPTANSEAVLVATNVSSNEHGFTTRFENISFLSL